MSVWGHVPHKHVSATCEIEDSEESCAWRDGEGLAAVWRVLAVHQALVVRYIASCLSVKEERDKKQDMNRQESR